ncbi:hypothetical protein BHE74_00046883 [Ensete ventricosum]|nr:hypothetical protein BHE74_00046883 [Ensete ventricosum]
MIIFLPKGCPNPSFPSTLPPSLPLRRRRLPLLTGSRPAKGRPPLRLSPLRASRCKQLCPRMAVAPAGWPQPVGTSTCRCRPYGLLPLRATDAGLPFRLAVVWSWVVGPEWGLAVAGRPSSSLHSLRKCNKNA